MVAGDQVIYGPMWTSQHDIRDWVINQKLPAIPNHVSSDIKGLPLNNVRMNYRYGKSE